MCLNSTFFRYSARSPHRATKPSRDWLRVVVRKLRLVLFALLKAGNKVAARKQQGPTTGGGVSGGETPKWLGRQWRCLDVHHSWRPFTSENNFMSRNLAEPVADARLCYARAPAHRHAAPRCPRSELFTCLHGRGCAARKVRASASEVKGGGGYGHPLTHGPVFRGTKGLSNVYYRKPCSVVLILTRRPSERHKNSGTKHCHSRTDLTLPFAHPMGHACDGSSVRRAARATSRRTSGIGGDTAPARAAASSFRAPGPDRASHFRGARSGCLDDGGACVAIDDAQQSCNGKAISSTVASTQEATRTKHQDIFTCACAVFLFEHLSVVSNPCSFSTALFLSLATSLARP